MSTVSNVTALGTQTVTKKRKSSTSSSSSNSSTPTAELTAVQQISAKFNGGSRDHCFEELAELISASIPDMTSSLSSSKPDKSAILQETVNQIRKIKQEESAESDAVQQSDVSSSRPTFLADKLFGPLFLEALDGFVFVVNTDGKILFVSNNVTSVLKYGQDDLMGKIIYDFIHINDHGRFSSSLLPITVGWVSDSSGASQSSLNNQKSRSFNCRLNIKKCEISDGSMEDRYENMQISAVLLPYPGEKAEPSDTDTEVQNCLVCIAHRIPTSESSSNNNNNVNSTNVEQFTTRLNFNGKIMAVDTSGVSSLYSQYLNKDLVGRIIQSLCHPVDLHKLNQHLKEVLQSGSNVSGVYRLQVSQDKYLHVQTSSKRFKYNQVTGEQEFIMSTHSIIRDSENESNKPASSHQNFTTISIPSPISTSSHVTPMSNITSSNSQTICNSYVTVNNTNINVPDTFTSNYTPLSLSQDLNLNDFSLDMFSGSNWDTPLSNVSSGMSTSIDNVVSTTNLSSNSIVTWPSTTISRMSAVLPTTVSSLSSGSVSTPLSPSIKSNRSPMTTTLNVTPSISTTKTFGASFPFSPLHEHENKMSPLNVTTASSAANLGFESILDGVQKNSKKGDDITMNSLPADSQVSGKTLKLRDLLTQGIEGENSNSVIASSDGETNRNNDQLLFANSLESKENRHSGGNIILRELLNQEDDEEELNSEGTNDKNIVQNNENRSRRMSSCGSSASSINTVLRTLLNEDDTEKNFNKKLTGGDQILQNLLKEDNSNDKHLNSTHVGESSDSHRKQSTSSMDDSILKTFGLSSSPSPSLQQTPAITTRPITSFTDVLGPPTKRRASDTDGPDTSVPEVKRSAGNSFGNGRIHLAGQNPMLASMLAQTPKQTHIVPTSIANALVSEIPQKKLPGDLEKKLVYTPITRSPQENMIATNTTHNSVAGHHHDHGNFSQHMLRTELTNNIQKDVVHISGPPGYPGINMQSPGFLSNLLMAPTQAGGLPTHSGSRVSLGPPNTVAPSAANSRGIPASGHGDGIQDTNHIGSGRFATSDSVSTVLQDYLNTPATINLTDISSSSSKVHSSDPVLSDILEDVCNMQQDIDTPITDDSQLLRILDEVLDPHESFTLMTSTSQSHQDLSEKMAISAITRQLMSVDPSTAGPQNHTAFSQQPPAYSSSQLAPPTYTQSSMAGTVTSHPPPPHPAYQQSQIKSQQHAAPPNYPNITQPPRQRYTSQQSLPNQLHQSQQQQQQQQQQFHNMSGGGPVTANIPPQIRQALLMQKQKQIRDSQQLRDQQRLLQQQQHQQIMMRTQQQPASHSIPPDQHSSSSPLGFENMNDLLNNTIAPNVALQRSTSLTDSQLSPRFSNQLPSPVPTSQISPGVQRPANQPPQQSYPRPPPHPSNAPTGHPTPQYQQNSPVSQLSPATGFFSPTSTSSNGQVSPNIGQQQQAQNSANGNFASNRSQLSPQPGSTTVQQTSGQWSTIQRPNSASLQQQNPASLQQQNPMLNAQLNQQATYNRPANRHPSAGNRRSLPSPGVNASVHSPFPQQQQQQQQQQDSFPLPQSPVSSPVVSVAVAPSNVMYQPQAVARMKRNMSVPSPGRVHSPRTPQGQFMSGTAGQESLLSPQPQMSPSYSHSLPSTPVSQQTSGFPTATAPPTPTSTITPATAPPAYSGGINQIRTPSTSDGQFSFDQQNIQMFSGPSSNNSSNQPQPDRSRNQNLSSEYVRQEIRSLIGSRNQHQVQPAVSSGNQQNLSHSLQQADLEALGLSLELEPEIDHSPGGLHHNINRVSSVGAPSNSPRLPGDDIRPNDQKRSSLLKQLLSE
ncbi:NCOA2 (predicted) [Pycnogonum litorale]